MKYVIYVNDCEYRTTNNYFGVYDLYRDAIEANPGARVEIADTEAGEFFQSNCKEW